MMQPPESSSNTRWRLILGPGAERLDSKMALAAQTGPAGDLARLRAMDRALEFVYGRRSLQGGEAGAERYLPEWVELLRSTFRPETVSLMMHDALQRKGLDRLLLQPELLRNLDPSPELIGALLSLREHTPPGAKAVLRELVQKLVLRLEERIRVPLVTQIKRGVAKQHLRRGSYRDLNWTRTLRRNLKHYDAVRQQLVPERIYFRGSESHSHLSHVMILVDQSASMAESVIHAAVGAAVIASVRTIRTSLILFGTEFADLSEFAQDPVEVLVGAQIGGGTDIAAAVDYALRLAEDPSRSVLVLVTDLYEGGDQARLKRHLSFLNESGCRTMVLLSVNADGRSDYNEELAGELAALGTPSFAADVEAFPQILGSLWAPNWPPEAL